MSHPTHNPLESVREFQKTEDIHFAQSVEFDLLGLPSILKTLLHLSERNWEIEGESPPKCESATQKEFEFALKIAFEAIYTNMGETSLNPKEILENLSY